MDISKMTKSDAWAWDKYVMAHHDSTLYHLSGWKNVIENTYGHKTYYLMAWSNSKPASNLNPVKFFREKSEANLTGVSHVNFFGENSVAKLTEATNSISSSNSANSTNISNSINPSPVKFVKDNSGANLTRASNSTNISNQRVIGILPLVHLKHWLFGNCLISLPYFDLGGILADDNDTARALLEEAIKLGRELKVNNIELRHIEPFSCLSEINTIDPTNTSNSVNCLTKSHKVRMLLDLPESSEILMKSFSSKLRSQIKKSMKEGLTAKIGGIGLLDDFYNVFSINMRDLGSPVHTKNLIKNVINQFYEDARIIIVYNSNQPIACSVVIAFKNILENPWASALRKFSRLSPNMLLYWTMLEYACNTGMSYFDFGRSSPDEGTFKFKEQWGAKPTTLHWHYCFLGEKPIVGDISEKSRFNKAIRYWQLLPVPVTKIIGPMIRKNIGL